MKRSRFTEEQIIGILREQELGAAVTELCRKHGVSSPTFYKWKTKYGGLDVSEARRLKALEERERQAEADAGGRHARQRRVERSARKKMVTPAAQREAAAYLRADHEMSQRRACRVIDCDR